LVATWSAFEFVGPCRFGAIADEGNEWGVPAGQPLGVQHPAAWAQRYGRRLKLKAVSGGANRHAVMWDMRDRRRQQTFTEAVD
ncbi:hypothetical protein KBZ21_39945, partial [Streptomyces sp. A73]|nr:hypothetical protein [Streptomyces sp. A73]